MTSNFTRTLRVVMIEDNIAWGNKKANLEQLKRNMRNIPEDTDLVVLPEMFTTGFITDDRERALELGERNTGETMSYLSRMAKHYGVAITGSFLATTATRLFNRAFFIEPNGDDTFYDKRHLFSMGDETKFYNGGTRPSPIIRFRGFNIKLIVCYDLRFPVFCRNVDNNYDVLVVVANWPKAREIAWRQLLIARAIENQAYVIGVNRCGTDQNGIEYSEGSSMIVDFRGKVVATRATSPVIGADLSPALLTRFREKFPAWRDADRFTLDI